MAPRHSDFQASVASLLQDPVLRANLKRGPGNLAASRRAVFPDPVERETSRDIGYALRKRAMDRLPELLEELERNCTRNGIRVHWAETGDEANDIVLDILRRRDVSLVVKGKSMATEETHLNAFLRRHGIEAIETDLGEYIIQLAGETPSHIITPAVHKNKSQIATLLNERLRFDPFTDDPAELTHNVRGVLREAFRNAGAGITGVNFAVAETGTLCLVENEGNGRMCTTVPPVHIAVMGIDKVVERLEDVPPLYSLLCRSATGQRASTYLNLISSPRRSGEKDGPEEVHLVLLDNGRTRIYADPELRQTLRCIRCAACLNVCPVYGRIGGHAYGHAYSGPIGVLLNTQLYGLEEAGAQLGASSLCGACNEVCPVRIPISELILRLRCEAAALKGSPVLGGGSQRKLAERIAWRGWSFLMRHPRLYRLFARAGLPLAVRIPAGAVPPLRAWTRVRTAPRPAPKPLHRRLEELEVDRE